MCCSCFRESIICVADLEQMFLLLIILCRIVAPVGRPLVSCPSNSVAAIAVDVSTVLVPISRLDVMCERDGERGV